MLLLLIVRHPCGGTRMGVGDWCHYGLEPCTVALYTMPECAWLTRARERGILVVELNPGLVPSGPLGEATHHFVPRFL